MESKVYEHRAHRTILGAKHTARGVSLAIVLMLLVGAAIGIRTRQQHARQREG